MSEKQPQTAPAQGPLEEAPTVRRSPTEPLPSVGETPTWHSSSGPVEGTFRALSPGQTVVGRYTVLDFLGQGGMGVVLAAYDSRLDRRVALKLVRHASGASGTIEESSRLVREAQAMARLSHPHVVAVYDSGTLEDGSLFIAMEHVQGQTLRQWRARQARSWREVLQAYLAAGRGLAAAHAAGLIHRDFKPDNVLVGEDGRVRVTDFGLARARSALDSAVRPPVPPAPSPTSSSASSSWSTALTLQGSFIGTPGYMAPELVQGHTADVRSDVFAFCAALYEALYGLLPFRGATATELTRAHLEGQVAPPPAGTEVPAWVARTVMRGLHIDPSQRPASLEELLAALGDDPEVKRRARMRTVALASIVGSLAALAAWGWARQQIQAPGCGQMERHLTGIWDEPTRAKVREALLGTGLPYAQDTFSRVSTVLDEYAGGWVKQRTAVCEAGQQLTALSQGLAVRQEYCLERRRSQLRALTGLLSRGSDPELATKAVQAAQALPPLEYCADAKALTAAVPPPEDPAVRARVDALQEQVDRLEALFEAGKYTEALASTRALQKQVALADHAPLHARILSLTARLREATGDLKGAEEEARRAIMEAARGKDLSQLALSWSHVLFLVGYRQARHSEALLLSPAAEASVELADDDVIRGHFLGNLGSLFQLTGKYEQAREHYERALALLEKARGPNHPVLANTLNNLGNTFKRMGRFEEALAWHERARALREKTMGAEHPALAVSFNNVGNVFIDMGRFEQAQMQYERALAIREKSLGPEHPDTITTLSNLGNILVFLGKYAEGLERHARVLTLRQKALGPEHPDVADSHNNLGSTLMYLGRYAEALEQQERALAVRQKSLSPEHPTVAQSLGDVGSALQALGRNEEARKSAERGVTLYEKVLGPEHPDVAEALRVLGNVLTRLRRFDDARQKHERSLSLREKLLGRDHPDTALSLLSLGELHLARGRPAEALPLLERALKNAHGKDQGDTRLALARALWETGQDRARAVSLATQARDDWQRQGNPPKHSEASGWLAAHASP